MQETLFFLSFDSELDNIHATNLPDTFLAIADTVSCFMHCGFDMLYDVSGPLCNISALILQF